MSQGNTIDGVSRDLLDDAAEAFAAIGMFERLEELRVLLDGPSAEPAEVVQTDNAEQALTLLDFALSFALCNMDHAGTRHDVKKAKAHLEAYRKFKAAQPQGEPIYQAEFLGEGGGGWSDVEHSEYLSLRSSPEFRLRIVYAEQPAPVADGTTSDKYKAELYDEVWQLARSMGFVNVTDAIKAPGQPYDDTLLPFLGMMRKELNANSGKGDRDGWLRMTPEQALDEIEHHHAKLIVPVMNRDREAIREHAADVANCAMMLLDVCGVLGRA